MPSPVRRLVLTSMLPLCLAVLAAPAVAVAGDPDCAMCWWGVALVLGPNVNAAMEAEAAAPAREAIARALELAPGASERERAYVEALAARYRPVAAGTDPAGTDPAALDRAYAEAMAAVVERFPDDADARTLWAESICFRSRASCSPATWAAARGDLEAAIGRYRAAVEIEDRLRYDEPPTWGQPARHSLGAALLAAGRPAEAETVYRRDLERHRENGWSLFGLAQSLRAQGEEAEAAAVAERFDRAWKAADVALASSVELLADGDRRVSTSGASPAASR